MSEVYGKLWDETDDSKDLLIRLPYHCLLRIKQYRQFDQLLRWGIFLPQV